MSNYDYIPKEIRDRIIWKRDKKQEGDPDQILGFRHEPTQCEGCDRIVSGRNVRMSICTNKDLHSHIKQQCQICKKYRNPQTGAFDLDFHALNDQFRRNKKSKD